MYFVFKLNASRLNNVSLDAQYIEQSKVGCKVHWKNNYIQLNGKCIQLDVLCIVVVWCWQQVTFFSSKIASKIGGEGCHSSVIFFGMEPDPKCLQKLPANTKSCDMSSWYSQVTFALRGPLHSCGHATYTSLKNLGLFSCSKIFFFCSPCFVSGAFCISNKLAGRSTLGFPPAVSEHIWATVGNEYTEFVRVIMQTTGHANLLCFVSTTWNLHACACAWEE